VKATTMMLCHALVFLALAFAVVAEISEAQSCTVGSCSPGNYCLNCRDGNSACFRSSNQVCCGCSGLVCWACSSGSQCTLSVGYCATDPVTTIVSCVVVLVILFFAFGIAGWRRYRYGYWGWNSEPAVVVTHYNDTTYGYDNHAHVHVAGGGYPAQTGYVATTSYTSAEQGYPAQQGYQAQQGYPAQQGYRVG